MSLATLFTAPVVEENINVWAFSNQDNHRLITDAIRDLLGISLEVRQLDPMPQDDNLQFWLQKHQQTHNDFTSVLGIEGADLTVLNLENEREVSAWTFLHANEHRLATLILGV